MPDMRRISFAFLLASIFAVPFENGIAIPFLHTLPRALGVIAFASWLLSVIVSRRIRRPEVFHFFVYGFVVWALASVLWSRIAGASIGHALTYLQLFALVLMIWDLCDSQVSIRTVMQAYVLGSWVALISLFSNFSHGEAVVYDRFASTGADPNQVAVALALGFSMAWHLTRDGAGGLARIANTAFLPAALLGVALSGSRGGMLASLVGVVFALSTLPSRKLSFKIAAALIVVSAFSAIVALVPDPTMERLASTGQSVAEGDLNGRLQLWSESVDAFVRYPITGSGIGASKAVLPSGKVSHNIALSAGVELGLVGLMLLAGTIAVALRRAWAQAKSNDRLQLALLGTWLVAGASLTLLETKATWVVLSLAVASAAVSPTPGVGRGSALSDNAPEHRGRA